MSYSSTKSELMTSTATVNEVDLFQWDIVNATTYKGINNWISLQGKTPADFKNANPGAGVASIDGTWDTWQLTPGGAGQELLMKLPIKTGTAEYPVAVAQYATLNPPPTDAAIAGKITLETDKLTLKSTDLVDRSAHALSAKTQKTGKIYFEVSVITNGSGVLIGLVPEGGAESFFFRNAKAISYRSNGVLYKGGAVVKDANGDNVIAEGWTGNGDTVGIAVDFDAKKAWLRGKDGTWQGDNADPVAGTGEFADLDLSADLFPVIALYANAEARINLGQTKFQHTPPTGFDPGIKVSDTTEIESDLTGAELTVRVILKKVDKGSSTKALMVDDAGTSTTEAVEIISMKLKSGGDAAPPTKTAFDAWLNSNIASFTNIFHAVDYAALVAANGDIKESMKWMAPDFTEYATVDVPASDPPDPNAPQAVFAVLNQTKKSTADRSTLAAEVSPMVFGHLKDSENAVVAISAERLTEEILLAGAQAIAGEGEDPGFQISDDKRVITNSKEFKMKPTKLSKVDVQVQPKVPVNGFTMRIEGRRIKIAYTGLKVEYKNMTLKANEDVTFGFNQTMFLKLEERDDGNHVLVPTFVDPLDTSKTAKGQIVDWSNVISDWKASMKLEDTSSVGDWIALICAAAGILLIGVVGVGMYCYCRAGTAAGDLADAAGTEMAENNGAADVNMPPIYDRVNPNDIYDAFPREAFQQTAENVYENVHDLLNVALPDDAGVAEGALAAHPIHKAGEATMLFNLHWGISFHGLRTIGRLDKVKDLNLTSEDVKKFAGGDVNVIGLEATVQKFLQEALSPFDWPETTGFDLTSGHLNGALLLQGTLKSNTLQSTKGIF